MKESKVFSTLLLCLNVAGLVCLVYFAIPYITHNTQISYPNAMLPAERWDWAGMALTVGMIPLFIANLLGFFYGKAKRNWLRFLFFLPSVMCLAIVAHYWITGIMNYLEISRRYDLL